MFRVGRLAVMGWAENDELPVFTTVTFWVEAEEADAGEMTGYIDNGIRLFGAAVAVVVVGRLPTEDTFCAEPDAGGRGTLGTEVFALLAYDPLGAVMVAGREWFEAVTALAVDLELVVDWP